MFRARISNPWGGIAVFLIIFGVCVNTAPALSGSGTEPDPWRIQSLADFNDFTADPNYWDDYTRLETDVNLAGRTYTTAVIAPDTIADSLETGIFQGTLFSGIFDGNGHVISNLTIDIAAASNDYLGLFGNIASGAEVNNLGVVDTGITARDSVHEFLGILCGFNSGSISNCYATGCVTGGDYSENFGALCGHSFGSISNCYTNGSVTGGEHSDYLGGVCGENDGSIINCYATGPVSAGGDTFSIGGICGGNNVIVSNCYATGSINAGALSEFLGGLCGENYGTVSNCFWDTVTSGISTSDGAIGKTTAQMQTLSTFTNANWDFINTWNIGENQTYPYLRTVPASDINKDKTVNFLDVCIIAEQWCEEE